MSRKTITANIIIPGEAIQKQEKQRGNAVLVAARNLVISNDQQYEMGGQFLQGIKGKKAEVKEIFGPAVEAAKAAKKAADNVRKEAVKLFDMAEAPYLEADKAVRTKMTYYYQEQERIRREAERKAEEEARQAAIQAAEEERLRMAEQAEQAGREDMAEKILEAPVVPAPYIPPAPVQAPPKAAGFTVRKTWRFVVTDASLIPEQYKTINQPALDAMARASKAQTNIPGGYAVEGAQSAVR